MNKRVLVACVTDPVLTGKLEELGYKITTDVNITIDTALEQIHQYEGLITSNKLPVDCKMIDLATKLRWVGRMGSGMEIIDVAYAKQKGIYCFSSPEGNANAVAEQALGMYLSLRHHIVRAYDELRKGIWLREENRGLEIEGSTAAIIGYGNNGSAFARKLVAMGVSVHIYDKHISKVAEPGITWCEHFEEAIEAADLLSYHVPLTTETFHYFNQETLRLVQKPLILLNLSRGEVVDTSALLQGMRQGVIAGAALDVWEKEPISKMEPLMHENIQALLQMPNFIGTPHIGGYTFQATYKMSLFLARKITDFLSVSNQSPGL